MMIGAIGNVYPNYVYNTNSVSANSMDKLSKISDNVLDKKVDYSETTAQENQNPLKKGETIDFEAVLEKVKYESWHKAEKILPNGLKPMEEQDITEKAKAQETNGSLQAQENQDTQKKGEAVDFKAVIEELKEESWSKDEKVSQDDLNLVEDPAKAVEAKVQEAKDNLQAQGNQEPQKKGEAIDFEAVIEKLKQESWDNGEKVSQDGLNPVEDPAKAEEAKAQEANVNAVADNKNASPFAVLDENGNNVNAAQMQRAIHAYEAFTA